MQELYNHIKLLPFDDQGWFHNHNQIQRCFKKHSINTVIEIGSWLGASTRFIAKLLPESGKIYAVDTWLGSQEDAHLKDSRLPYLYHLFLSNVKHEKLTHKIVPVRMTSQEAAQALTIKADLIYIDAAHDEYSVYQDIISWADKLNPQGILCGDDWKWDSVKEGILRAARELNWSTLYSQENFWWLAP